MRCSFASSDKGEHFRWAAFTCYSKRLWYLTGTMNLKAFFPTNIILHAKYAFNAIMIGALAVSAALMLPYSGAEAQRRGAGDDARQQMLDGNVKSLKEIEANILPFMKGMKYLGPEYDSRTRIYRLKFIRDNRVTFVDVDARTGRILRRQ